MNKLLFPTLALFACQTIMAQEIVIGDMNSDGKVTIQDITECTNTVLGITPVKKVPMGNPYASDQATIAGSWRSVSGTKLVFGTDGTASHNEINKVESYEYYPYRGDILLLDEDKYIIKYYHLVRMTDQYIVLCEQGSKDLLCFYSGSVPVTEIQLDRTSCSIQFGKTFSLTATTIPTNAILPKVRWSTSDSRIATVDQDGNVTACGSGTCEIIATAIDGTGVSKACTVTVTVETNGHDYVDLGLSVKWATMNIGARTREDSGLYYCWGETETKDDNTWGTYKFCDSNYNMTKYCTNSSYGPVDNKTVLEMEDDAAHMNWGGDWRTPTYEEFNELKTKCTWTWGYISKGKYGYIVMSNVDGYKGKYIFLPAAGYLDNGNTWNEGSKGYYWTSSLSTSRPRNASYLFFDSKGTNSLGLERFYSQSIRPVCP